MKEVKLSAKLRYAFDNSIAQGTGAMIRWLGVVAFASILLVALFAKLTLSKGDVVSKEPEEKISLTVDKAELNKADGKVTVTLSKEQLENPEAEEEEGTGIAGDGSISHLMWMGLMRTLDSGTMGGDDGSVPTLIWMLVFTLTGIFLISTLIGLITSGVENKIEDLRKGRSLVIEEDHILILGWSSKIFTILEQLCLANQSHPKPRIVILADKDKVEMEDEISSRIKDPGRVKIICRSGSPIDVGDLEMVNPDDARTIIVMPPEEEDPDAQVVKVILALVNNPNRNKDKKYHIVAELHDRKNIDVVQIISRGEVEMIESPGLIARITVQTCRQSGLSVIYSDLLDFGGCEIYFKEEPQLVGKTFGESLLAYEECSVLGVRRASGQVQLLPGMDTTIAKGDHIIMLAEDDSTIRFTGISNDGVNEQLMRNKEHQKVGQEGSLILGWNKQGPVIVRELDKYVAKGSKLTIVTDIGDPESDVKRECSELANVELLIKSGDTTDRAVLNSLEIPSYDHVILLSCNDELEVQRADARSLITLLHLRDICDNSPRRPSIVGEILDVRNRDLAEVTRADDFIVSDKLVSLMMAQVAENKDLNAVFADLFDPEGAEIYLKSAGDYVALGQPVNIRTLVASARARGEIVMGYRKMSDANNATRDYGVNLNPKKAHSETFTEADKIIVLAEV